MPKHFGRDGLYRSITTVRLPQGMPPIEELRLEIDDMVDVLNGHEEPDIALGELTLLEVSTAYLGRALEWQGILHRAEITGDVLKSSPAYLFRTRELASFIDLCKAKVALGQRRVTWAQNDMTPSLADFFGWNDDDDED
jgi:hypothetical protein